MRAERQLVIVLLAILFWLLLGSTLRAQFGIVEDHHIFRARGMPLARSLALDVSQVGRARPMYFVFRWARVKVLGTDPFAWHLLTTSLGVATAFLLYLAMRGCGADPFSSVVFALLACLIGPQSAAWYLLVTPAETLGMLFVALSLWALVRASSRPGPGGWDAVFLIAAGMAGLNKESFVLLLPALLVLRLTLHCHFNDEGWRTAVRRLKAPLLAGSAVFILQALGLALVAALNPGKHGPAVVGLSGRSFSPAGWLGLLAAPGLVPIARQLPLAVLVLMAFCSWPGRESRRRYLIAGLLVAAAWLAPQLVIYSHGLEPRYLFPMILAPAATVSLGLAAVWPARSWLGRAAWAAQLLWLLPTVSDGVRATSEMANRFTAETWSVHRLVTFLARSVPPGRAIVIAADPATSNGFEAVHALPVYLAAAGSTSQAFLWPVAARPDLRSPFAAEVEARTRASYALPGTLVAAEVGGIILVDTPGAGDTLPRWFSEGSWQPIRFVEPFSALTLPRLRFVSAGEVGHVVLVPGVPPSEYPPDSPLIRVSTALRGSVGLSPLLKTPWWGVESDPSGSLVWLGDGESGEMSFQLWSGREQQVRVVFDVAPGPGLTHDRRRVELTFAGSAAPSAGRQFEGQAALSFPVELRRGYNALRFRALDRATVARQPNGDTRPLVVLLRGVRVETDP